MSRLNSYYFFTGEPDSFQADLNRFLAVEPAAVKAWASKVLIPERLELHIRPPTPEEEAAAEASAEEGGAE